MINERNPNRLSWDETFMNLALITSKRSACLYYKVGAVFADENNRIISLGYNGPGEGDYHCNEVGCAKIDGNPETGKLEKCRGVHAEINGIINAFDTKRLRGCKLYVTVFPCFSCMKTLNNVSIKEIIYLNDYIRIKEGGDETEREDQSADLAKRKGIILRQYKGKLFSTPEEHSPKCDDCA